MNEAYTITDTAITVMVEGRTQIVNKDDSRFEKVKSAIRKKTFDLIPKLLDLKGELISKCNGGLYLLNGMLRCDKYDVPASLATRILEYRKDKIDITPLTNYFTKLAQNPNESGTVFEELHAFIEASNLPICADGDFLAYKMVTHDFKDLHTKTMDNSVGSTVEIPRNECSFNRKVPCAPGLHFCSEEYLSRYNTGSRIVVVKVNPRDVTSIPNDHNLSKGRACKYEIVDAVGNDHVITPLFTEEYTESEETPVPGESEVFRWEVRSSDSGTLLKTFATRQDARDYRNSNNVHADDYNAGGTLFIYDVFTGTVVSGTVNDDVDLDNLDTPDPTPPATVPNPGAKLTEDEVRDIKVALQDGWFETITEIANHYGVSRSTIRRIRDGESWSHVEV
jgi:predicted DNA binding protein